MNRMVQSILIYAIVICIVQCHINSEEIFNGTRLNFGKLAKLYGYSSEQYEVITEDGYVLTLFRIPGRSRFPVLLVHGILDSADTWIIRGESSLAISLAKYGYDVWLANTRGNRYSRGHMLLNPDKDASFWKYSFHEVGFYDLPAFINRILDETRAPSLSAIGHSQGNTAFYVLGSTRPEYNNKVNVMVALAPVCYLHHSMSLVSTFIKISHFMEKIIAAFNINEILGETSPISKILRTVCPTPVIGYSLCLFGLLFPLTGYDTEELEPTFYQKVVKHFPAGASSMSFLHYLQVGSRKIFAPFDDSPNINKLRYNSTIPPPYNFGKVNMPIALLAAKNDFLSSIPDVILLKDKLPNVIYYLVNPHELFNHVDYVWGRRIPIYLVPYILQILQRFNGFE